MSLLLVEDEPLFARSVRDTLSRLGLSVVHAATVAEARARLDEQRFTVAVLDQHLGDGTGLALMPDLAGEGSKVIVITADPSFEHAVKALRAGAWDYLAKPFELEALVHAVERARHTATLERAARAHAQASLATLRDEPGLAQVLPLLEAAAGSDAQVLLTGETGSGKTRLARLVHQSSARRAGPFLEFNCAALPEQLVEAELFGWEKGAFTGAVGTREGLFEQAEGGTLFLDELGEMPLPLQAKLLTVIEERRVRRLGGRSSRVVDVRIIAATNVDVDGAIAAGRLRADLLFRLEVLRIQVPSLRARLGDLPRLCSDLLGKLSPTPRSLAPGELELLARHDWPGNVRELRNVLERAVLLEPAGPLHPSRVLPSHERQAAQPAPAPAGDEGLNLEEHEARLIKRALARTSGNLTAAAALLGISLSTLKRRVKGR